MSFSGGRQVQPGQLRTMSPAGQRRIKPAVGKVVNTLRTALEELQREGLGAHPSPAPMQVPSSGDQAQPISYLSSQVKALQKGFGMLADAVLEELESVRDEAAKMREERSAWYASLEDQQARIEAAVDMKLGELDNFRVDMEQWKQGVTDILAGARQEVMAASFQPLEDKVEEINAVLSGLVKSSSNTQLAAIQLESRVESHIQEYIAERASYDDMFTSVRSLVETSEGEAARVSEALASDVDQLRQDLNKVSDLQQSFLQEQAPSVAALQEKVTAVVQHQARHANSLEEIIRGQLSDLQSLAKKTRAIEYRVSKTESSNSDTYEALARSCQVFASALKIPSPIPVLSSALGSRR